MPGRTGGAKKIPGGTRAYEKFRVRCSLTASLLSVHVSVHKMCPSKPYNMSV